jgi:hypothetical protein
MPVNLPPQPVGQNLPDEPQDPPHLNDVIAAKNYQDKVDSAVGQLESNLDRCCILYCLFDFPKQRYKLLEDQPTLMLQELISTRQKW